MCGEGKRGGNEKEENIYILEEWHNFLFKTSSNAESPGKTFQFDFPSCESNQKLLSRFNLLMRSSDWKLVIALSAWLIISILVWNSFNVWKYLCMVMKLVLNLCFDDVSEDFYYKSRFLGLHGSCSLSLNDFWVFPHFLNCGHCTGILSDVSQMLLKKSEIISTCLIVTWFFFPPQEWHQYFTHINSSGCLSCGSLSYPYFSFSFLSQFHWSSLSSQMSGCESSDQMIAFRHPALEFFFFFPPYFCRRLKLFS